MWTLETIYEPDMDPTPDLIPNIWIISDSKCWYPLNFRISTIKTKAKSLANPDPGEWVQLKIDIIEKDISMY